MRRFLPTAVAALLLATCAISQPVKVPSKTALNGKPVSSKIEDAQSIVTGFLHEGEFWRQLRDEATGKRYFYNTVTYASQWGDPRKDTAWERAQILVMFLLPFVLVLGTGAAYVSYMKARHPEKFKISKKKSSPKKTKPEAKKAEPKSTD